jgi:hypothetical protein
MVTSGSCCHKQGLLSRCLEGRAALWICLGTPLCEKAKAFHFVNSQACMIITLI